MQNWHFRKYSVKPLSSRTFGGRESASGWVVCLRIMSANNIDMPAKERHSSTGASFQHRSVIPAKAGIYLWVNGPQHTLG